MYVYLNFSVRYSKNALKTQNYYPDLIDFKYAPLTYTLCGEGSFDKTGKFLALFISLLAHCTLDKICEKI